MTCIIDPARGWQHSSALAPPWLLHWDQVMVGTEYRRWDGTWDGLDPEERCLISRAATRQGAVNALLAAEHGK